MRPGYHPGQDAVIVTSAAGMPSQGGVMELRRIGIVGLALAGLCRSEAAVGADAASVRGPYARIAVLRPRDGRGVDFEAGYIRHLEWHRKAGDTWAWYGWSIWASAERQRWFVYASFGHSAASLDGPVAPADDERDNVLNVSPHVEWMGNALYEFLPALSRGTGVPQPAARVELTTVDLAPPAAKRFEAALAARQPALQGETLWYRIVVGGDAPRYVRLRPRPSLSALLGASSEQGLPEDVGDAIVRTTVEVLTLQPSMSLGIAPAARD
jgi:hypothetical protein